MSANNPTLLELLHNRVMVSFLGGQQLCMPDTYAYLEIDCDAQWQVNTTLDQDGLTEALRWVGAEGDRPSVSITGADPLDRIADIEPSLRLFSEAASCAEPGAWRNSGLTCAQCPSKPKQASESTVE